MKFSKMNGCGNDYVFVYLPENKVQSPAELARRVSDRHFGIGSDGLVLIDGSSLADCSMRIFNSDGSEANMCGNALRCVAKYVFDRGLTNGREEVTVSTLAGVKTVRLDVKDGKACAAQADLGCPNILKLYGSRQVVRTVAAGGIPYEITPVEIGNYHAVRFVKRLSEKEMRAAKAISASVILCDTVNVEIAHVIDRENIEARVWERGSGETLACGTGAGAILYAAFLRGLTGAVVNIRLPGGTLEAEFLKGRIYIRGPANLTFEGTLYD